MSDFTVIDHSAEAIAEKNLRVQAALEALGNQVVSYAKSNITKAGRVDTGAMRNSVSHLVVPDEEAVYVGTNQEYAVYNELGTGIYLEGGGGRQTPWSYKDHKGEWHITRGMKPTHFLRNAVQDHIRELRQIAEQYLKG